jgi:hypothetical protein
LRNVTILGLFDRREQAERLIGNLHRELGAGAGSVQLHTPGPAAREAAPAPRLPALPAEERALYEEGLRRGAVPVSVETDQAAAGQVMAAFEAAGAADLDACAAAWRGEAGTRDTGYTGHDEDIGFATYGGDAVIRRIPRKHHDDAPAGLLGRFEMAAMQDAPTATRHARCYVAADGA